MEADNYIKFVIVQQIYDMKKPSDSLDDKMLSLINDKLFISLNLSKNVDVLKILWIGRSIKISWSFNKSLQTKTKYY